MPPLVHFLKPTFAGGEYAPSLYSRVDLQRYASGAKLLKNFIVHPHGGASNRPGWHFASKGKIQGKKVRLHDFQFSRTQTYTIEFGEYYCRFYTNSGQIAVTSASSWLTSTAYVVGNFVSQGGTIYYCVVAHTSGTFATDLANGKWVAQSVYEIPTPYSEADLPLLNFTQSADVLFIFHPLYQTRQLNRLGDTNWTLTLYDFLYGPFMLPNADTTWTLTPSGTTGNITLTASKNTFFSTHVGALFQLRHPIAEQNVGASLSSVTNTGTIMCGGTWRIITHGTWAGTISIQKSTDGGSTWTNVRTFNSNSDYNAQTYGMEDMSNNADPFLIRVAMTSYSSGTCQIMLTSDSFTQIGVIKVTAYTSATQVSATVKKQVGAASATFDWSEGSWSDYRGWPSVGEFCQDRLVTGNSKSEPQTSWLTKTGNYYDYSRSVPLVDSDGITVNLPTRQQNGIVGFVPLTVLIAMTASSEWSIGTSSNALSPTTADQKVHGYTGASPIKPVVIKNRAIFVQAMGAFLQDLGYELQSDSFTGSDLSILANHLFMGHKIIDLAYQQYPDSIVWAVRDDGILLSMTYMREQEVLAWTWHETLGQVESICVIPSNGYNQVWLSVKRGNDRFIEYMDNRMASTRPQDQFFVDAGIIYNEPLTISGATKANPVVVTVTGHGYSNGDLVDIASVSGMTQINGKRFKAAGVTANTFQLTDQDTGANVDGTSFGTYVSGGTSSKAVNVITGLDHLEGYSVSVLADGNVVASPNNPAYPIITVSGGQITIPINASKVIVGIPYTPDLETLNVEVNLADGTAQGRKVKIPRLVIRMLNSRGGFIGPDANSLTELANNFRDLYDTALELYSGDLHHTMGGGYSDGGRVFIRQLDPLPITVLAIMPIVAVGGMAGE